MNTATENTKKAIIVGASSGIGYYLARELDAEGYELAICARRAERLNELNAQLSKPALIKTMDVIAAEDAMVILETMIAELGKVDLIILNAGIAELDFDLSWDKSAAVIDTNVRGITALAGVAYRYFREQDYGHLVGVSSIAALRGGAATSYNASKAYLSSYLEGLRFLISKQKLNINVTDIRPGFVETAIIKGKTFWMSTPEVAAQCILRAIKKRAKIAYITPRWRLIAWLARIIPDHLYFKM